ncbi:substrate-binding domain-containing protein [Pelagibacterium flavum]|uniref:Substrate-binding domain-containing protein n=1 Tax=Pelagibacterium flavum TaxID=2984530 RepID=A0ABY6IPY6_9HYPH|nr:substrate-binding domain-containing protein [Pelagibacterium sp. YIM 151497]MAN76077.1 sugar ABC transporter substrate-binding protein [Hyphomicrobiales bacterium]UYQ72536.1 substrate-binding domain-containing protein [Pelagibacterium sp. YIM 151497]|tara:strand:- start:4280 stop:5296 length:1017 start_codon:yes stop_codon:yes gene_type:complete
MSIAGLGPHGERAVPADQIQLTAADATEAKARRFSVAVVLHTTTSDWSKQELAGIAATLGLHSAALVEVVDCNFDVDQQIAALTRLAGEPVDAVISIPIGNARVAAAHRALTQSEKKLVLLDNAPTGMLPGTDYASVVSTDNFGLGQSCAAMLSRHIPPDGVAGILGYGIDFFATHEREIAFRKWMGIHRPDVTLVRERFSELDGAGAASLQMLKKTPQLSGIFAVWDVPAMKAVRALAQKGFDIPVTTVDLGNEVALDMARRGMIKGVGAQMPYDQGSAAARVTLAALLGLAVPPWVALGGREVTAFDVVEAYQVIWHQPAPRAIIESLRGSADSQN